MMCGAGRNRPEESERSTVKKGLSHGLHGYTLMKYLLGAVVSEVFAAGG